MLINDTFSLVGSRLRELRGELTQKELADLLGVNRSYVAQVETGAVKPSVDYLIKVSKHFGVSIDWILTGMGPNVSNTNILELEGYDPEFEAMVSYLRDTWKEGDQDLRGWIKIQFKRAYPDFEENRQKKQGVAREGTTNGA